MLRWLLFLVFAILMNPSAAQTINFDQTPAGSLPAGWVSGSTGGGKPNWAVEADPTAPSKPNVLKQSGSGTYPWAVKQDALRVEFQGARIRVLLDGKSYIEEENRAISGPAAVGVWTKADSVTAFDDFGWGALTR